MNYCSNLTDLYLNYLPDFVTFDDAKIDEFKKILVKKNLPFEYFEYEDQMLIEELKKRNIKLDITIDDAFCITAVNCSFGVDEVKLYRWVSFGHPSGDIQFGYKLELPNRMELISCGGSGQWAKRKLLR